MNEYEVEERGRTMSEENEHEVASSFDDHHLFSWFPHKLTENVPCYRHEETARRANCRSSPPTEKSGR